MKGVSFWRSWFNGLGIWAKSFIKLLVKPSMSQEISYSLNCYKIRKILDIFNFCLVHFQSFSFASISLIFAFTPASSINERASLSLDFASVYLAWSVNYISKWVDGIGLQNLCCNKLQTNWRLTCFQSFCAHWWHTCTHSAYSTPFEFILSETSASWRKPLRVV